ncbi:hypothetical protein [Nannocystis pusilla]|uniref:hypothetical protein n=1 Tax=Nannocystis pusilla TaxID=889268 RepID=UPI003B77DAB5
MSPELEIGVFVVLVLVGALVFTVSSVFLIVLLWRSPRRLAEALVEPLTRELRMLAQALETLAQATDARVTRLENRIREITGPHQEESPRE